MSYIRFSNDNYKSDVYLFENTSNQYELWVADLRYKRDKEDKPVFSETIEINHELAGLVVKTKSIKLIEYLLKKLKKEGFYIPKYRLFKGDKNF